MSGSLLTLIFPSKERARKVAATLGTTTLDNSGWHVYFNMEHILAYMHEQGRDCGRGSFPRTDDILERSVNISIGVVDEGSGYGININSSDVEIEKRTVELKRAIGTA